MLLTLTHTHTALARAQNCRRSFHTEWHLLVRAQKTIWQGRADGDSCQDTRLEVVQGLEASCTVYIGFFLSPLSLSVYPTALSTYFLNLWFSGEGLSPS